MRIGIVWDRDSIVGRLYPGAFPEISDPPGAFLSCQSFDEAAFSALWAATRKYDGKSEAVAYESSGCDVGVPHDAPDFVPMLAPSFVEDLAAISDHERWRVAQQWAQGHLGQRPNEQKSALYKTCCASCMTLPEPSPQRNRGFFCSETTDWQNCV